MTTLFLRKLGRICRSLGGRLVLLPSPNIAFLDALETHRNLSTPDTSGSKLEYGIRWRRKLIYAVRDTDHIGYIIHEAGHVFAERFSPDHDKCDEWEWLGWEIAVARSIGAYREWSEQNCGYSVGDDGDWGGLSQTRQEEIAVERVAHAKKIGLLSKRGAPRSVRS